MVRDRSVYHLGCLWLKVTEYSKHGLRRAFILLEEIWQEGG